MHDALLQDELQKELCIKEAKEKMMSLRLESDQLRQQLLEAAEQGSEEELPIKKELPRKRTFSQRERSCIKEEVVVDVDSCSDDVQIVAVQNSN